jgi:protein O-GlcNAc transferase
MSRKKKSKPPARKPLAAKPALHQLPDVANWLQDGFSFHREGRLYDAQVMYEQILQKQGNNFDALQLLALAHMQQGNVEIALEYFDKALQVDQTNATVFYNRGLTLQDLKRPDEAIKSYDQAIGLNPDFAQAYNNRGNALQDLGRLEEALISYGQAIRLDPDYAEAYSNQGLTLQDLKRLDEALKRFDQAIGLRPDYAEAYYNRGNALQDLGRLEEALKSYDQAIRLNPDYAAAHNNRGLTLQDLKQLDEAIKSYDQAIGLNPDHIQAYNNRGNALQDLRRLDEALKSYDQAIRLNPNYADAYNNRGVTLQDLKQLDEALKSYDQAIRLKPDYADAYNNRGNALLELKRLDEALSSYDQTIRLKPDYEFILGNRLHTQMKLCDWSNFSNRLLELQSCLLTERRVTTPFPVLGLFDNPEIHLLASKIYVDTKYPASQVLGPFIKRVPDGKIRVGYYSADFHNHATAYLMAELFESHDPNRFEIYGFSFGPNKNDEMHLRLSKTFKQFSHVSNFSDIEIAKLSRELGIDIAVDLKGFTGDSRTGIFALRCAPIQVNYLGYPGTMGAPYIDYIVADQTVIPIENQKYYSEKIVYMPHSYQVNDAHRKISDKLFTKQELGLPEESFVFCSFNNNYKILPETFDIWMDLLQEVDSSVLWLFEDNLTASVNLRLQAQHRGVDPSRLVFAKPMDLVDHLARHQLADLCLDTLPYNAHTTASDALWAGLPVLTLPGQSFAARVAASLLTALDMPELIAESREDYREKAISLATNQVLLKQIKEKLNRNRLIAPLFNGQIFAKNIEKAYEAMIQRHANDQSPDHIYISY